MATADFLSYIPRLFLAAVAGLSLVDLLRNRDRMRLEIALMLSTLGIASLVGLLSAEIRAIPVISIGAGLVLVAQPYQNIRLVTFFRPVPRLVVWAAAVGMAGSSLALLLGVQPVATPIALGIIGYFIVFSSYAAWAFYQGMRNSGGSFRGRMAFAATGSALLALIFVFSGIGRFNPSLAAVSSATLPAVVAAAFYLAFLPPPWLRQAWRLPELHRFLQGVAKADPRDLAPYAGRHLCWTVTRLSGGTASAVLLMDADGERLTTEAADRQELANTVFPAGTGIIGRVLQESAPMLAEPSDFSEDESRLAQALGSKAVLAVPILRADRKWGVLLAFRPQGRLFADDLLELMSLLAAQYALILENNNLLREQERLVAHLQRANEEMESFSYSISHDLRRPLRAIDGFSDALIEDYADNLDAQGIDYLNRVRAAAQSMGYLIDELLKLSRLTQQPLRSQKLDMSALARSIAGELQDREPQRQVTFTIPDGVSAQGDPALVRLVVENLLDNAWKFTSARQGAAIEFGMVQSEGEDAYFVKDNGAGFESIYANKLFLPFQRLHTPQEFPGTGIGLATVRWIIRRHGGRVWAEGATGQGAQFYFTLPAKG